MRHSCLFEPEPYFSFPLQCRPLPSIFFKGSWLLRTRTTNSWSLSLISCTIFFSPQVFFPPYEMKSGDLDFFFPARINTPSLFLILLFRSSFARGFLFHRPDGNFGHEEYTPLFSRFTGRLCKFFFFLRSSAKVPGSVTSSLANLLCLSRNLLASW